MWRFQARNKFKTDKEWREANFHFAPTTTDSKKIVCLAKEDSDAVEALIKKKLLKDNDL